jgi:phosphoribosylaminoimidazolecarboxamide formyltransferase/IMP cyclohydrolase
VFHKEGLEPIARELDRLNISVYSTGGTERYLSDLGLEVQRVEDLTLYPSILGGRVKTLHPKVFGGILARGDEQGDLQTLEEFDIPVFDAVIVDLYPFEKTVASGATESEIIEKIDIGGISLIRAAAKNYRDVLCVASEADYTSFLQILTEGEGRTTLEQRKDFARKAFAVSSHYDSAIFNHFEESSPSHFLRVGISDSLTLRYGENPHQEGRFYGDLGELFDKLHGKELSYNNLLDIDAAVQLMSEFQNEDPTFAILKHNNACGLATRDTIAKAYRDALAGDPVSAFGGILISNRSIDRETAEEIHKLFCEVVIAPDFEADAREILKGKAKRILLRLKSFDLPAFQARSCLNGVLGQQRDLITDKESDFSYATENRPDDNQVRDLIFASKICKHTKSNTIVLAKDRQLLASGTGQTSRVDALQQAIHKAGHFKFSLQGAVMASDAFFPFPDCVEIADQAGIRSVIQPGGSIKDQLSIDYCNDHGMNMVLTGTRHFKH